MAEHDVYHGYLRNRSRLGLLYRNQVLYPRIAPYLTGHTIDIGCGIGDMLQFRPGTVGVDINPANVAFCRSLGLDAREMPIDSLPLEDSSFDSALLDNVLEHIADPTRLLAEICRVLRTDGRLVVGVPGRKGYASDDDHKLFYDEDRLVSRMADAGFKTVRLLHVPLRSAVLDRHMRQYCVYGVFARD